MVYANSNQRVGLRPPAFPTPPPSPFQDVCQSRRRANHVLPSILLLTTTSICARFSCCRALFVRATHYSLSFIVFFCRVIRVLQSLGRLATPSDSLMSTASTAVRTALGFELIQHQRHHHVSLQYILAFAFSSWPDPLGASFHAT